MRLFFFFFSSRRRHTRYIGDWSSDVCSSDLVALALVAIGIGGLLAYAVARRTNEIGVRMALGATSSDVIRMVLRDSLRIAGAGILIGLPCAYATGKILENALFRLKQLDPWTAALSFFALLAVALLDRKR